MKTCFTIIIATFLLLKGDTGFSQGFLNLNFEKAKIVPDDSQGNPFIYASNAIPNWTFIFSGSAQSDITYNFPTLDAAYVTIIDTNSFFIAPLQGKYTLYLQGGTQYAYLPHDGVSIMQTGQVPVTAQSLIYWGGPLVGSFNGQALAFNAIGSGTGYTIWQADISSFAGQTGQLMFTAPWKTEGLLDNIQFSNLLVPEPSTLFLSAVGATCLASLRRRKAN